MGQVKGNRLRYEKWFLTGFVLLLGFTSLAGVAAAQETTRDRLLEAFHDMGIVHAINSVAVSPDGSLLAYAAAGQGGLQVWVAPIGDVEHPVRVTAAKKDGQTCGESNVSWAPDSRRLAFVSDCEAPPAQKSQDDVFLATIGGDPQRGKPSFTVERLTSARGEVGYPQFSPNGSKVAFLYVEGATRAAGALAAMKPWSGVIGEDGVEVQRVAMVPAMVHAMSPVFVTPARLHVFEFDWSPDSKSLAYIAADPPGENNWWVAKLYAQTVEPAAQPRVVFAPAESPGGMHGLQMAVPRWSPDAKAIAFIGGLMSDQGSTGGDVWVVPARGPDSEAEVHDLTPGRKTSPAWITWADDAHLFVSELAGGNSQLVKMEIVVDDAKRRVTTSFSQPIFSFPGTVGDGRLQMSLSTSKDHSIFAFHAASYDHPVEAYAVRPTTETVAWDGLKRLTHINQDLEPGREKVTSLSWTNEGFDVQGWLHFPKGYDPSRHYPLLVLVHGGPSAAALARWGGGGGFNGPLIATQGYFVFEPNPRGSYGQGEAFTAANRKDFGYGDLRDILAGVDAVLAKYPIDPTRVGLLGWSYGGFMTMFGVTQTQRFRAAVAGAGIADWQSYYGENSIDQWMTPFFGASVYRDPAVYAKSSAINFIDRVNTPTLIVVGDRDGECPAPQSFEFWHALRDAGVPTQLVVYPNEGHGFTDVSHVIDVQTRTVDWFDKYMPAAK